jgi:hypothetical protein
MARRPRQQRHLLSAAELALVEKTQQPSLRTLSDRDLARLRKLVRERRDRTGQIAACQRRELRGKSSPKGARAATDDTGSRRKKDLLAAAVEGLDKEVARRKAKTSRLALIDTAARALELRRGSKARSTRPSFGRSPNKGMRMKTHAPRAPRNSAKAGAISQHTKNMQAKRDSK